MVIWLTLKSTILLKVLCICARMSMHTQHLIKFSVFSVARTAMDSYDDDDNRMMESEQSVQVSRRSDRKDSALSGKRNRKHRENNGSSIGNRARTRTREQNRDPDKDRISDGNQSSASFYSDDYENSSLSDRSFSPRSPSLPPHRGERKQTVSSSPVHPTGTTTCTPSGTFTSDLKEYI